MSDQSQDNFHTPEKAATFAAAVLKQGRPSLSTLRNREGTKHKQNLDRWLEGANSQSPSLKRTRSSPEISPRRGKRLNSDLNNADTKMDEGMNSVKMADVFREIKEMRHENKDDKKELIETIMKHHNDLKNQLDEQERRWTIKWQETDKRLEALEESMKIDGNTAGLKDINTRLITLGKKVDYKNSSSLQEEDLVTLTRCQQIIEEREKEKRKLNLIIKGLECDHKNYKEKVEHFIESKFKLANKIEESILLSGEKSKSILKIKMADTESKYQIIKSKGAALSDSSIYIEFDKTPLERDTWYNIRQIARAERSMGKTVKTTHNRIQIDGSWFMWNTRTKSLSPISTEKLNQRQSEQSKN